MKITTCLILLVVSAALVATGCSSPPSRPSSSNSKGATPDSGEENGKDLGEDKDSTTKPNPEKTRLWVNQVMADTFQCSATPQNGDAELRLMTPDEYQNTIRDVLQIKTDYRPSLFKPAEVSGFSNNADVGTVDDTRLGYYLTAAQKIADEVRPNLTLVAGCPEADSLDCANKVIASIAPRLWRRPLLADEKNELLSFYNRSKVPAESMTLLMMRLLTSTNFLYRSEIGSDAGLTPYELASALSYFFWGTIPDQALVDLAANNTLTEEKVLISQANRLLADKRSSHFLNSFSGSWLGYKRLEGMEKDTKLFPNFTPEISNLMIAEANNTFEYFVRQNAGTFENLMSHDFSVGGAQLAKYYKVSPKKVGTTETLSFEDEPRRGIFSLGAVFASLSPPNQTNPFRVGGFFMSRLLCDEPIPTPDGLVVTLPEPKAGATERELAEAHSNNPSCKGCHVKIDGIGFALQNFDAVGVYRTTQNGKAIDPSGKLVGIEGKTYDFKGADGLSALLSASRQAKRCFTIQLFRYAHGHLEREKSVCPIREVAESFETEDLTLSELIVKVITHNSFRKRGK
ncbi:MAG: DUF1592 domain-containing protein [Bdellovibrionota bacterium]